MYEENEDIQAKVLLAAYASVTGKAGVEFSLDDIYAQRDDLPDRRRSIAALYELQRAGCIEKPTSILNISPNRGYKLTITGKVVVESPNTLFRNSTLSSISKMVDRISNSGDVKEGYDIDRYNKKRPLSVFISHSSRDSIAVRELYRRLQAEDGIDPWLDEKTLLAGQEWEFEIRKAIRSSDVILVCLSSNSVTKRGYVQTEIKLALDDADKQPEGTIFIIPVRLDESVVPEPLSRYQWVNLYEANGYERLLRALRAIAKELRLSTDNPRV
jgi:hypothetical protein